MSAPLLAPCPDCNGTGRAGRWIAEDAFEEYRCDECNGLGSVLVPCSWPGCWTAAVRRSVGEPAVAYCDRHDLCALCEQAPAGPEDYCAKCAADLVAVAPETVGATA